MKMREIPIRELNERGHRALLRELGPAGMVQFLRQFEYGHGDYTRDRHLWLDQLDEHEFLESVKQRQEEAKRKPAKRRQPPKK